MNEQPEQSSQLRDDARQIWQAAVAAADSRSAVSHHPRIDSHSLQIAGQTLPLAGIDRVIVVGAGKAGAGMAAGLEDALRDSPLFEKLSGWVNVPDNCLRPLQKIHLHGGRPAGVNEPTEQVLDGTDRILQLVSSCTPRDLCVMLLSGGGSALLCRPVPGISLADKLTVTRLLSRSGAPIHELNLVRTQLSLVKGGRLAAACRAQLLATLAISDVIGDPPQVIGSGPTVPMESRPAEALAILRRRGLYEHLPPQVMKFLSEAVDRPPESVCVPLAWQAVASNAVSLRAAAACAERLGYDIVDIHSDLQGAAAEAGAAFYQQLQLRQQQDAGRRICLLAGGETTVNVATAGTEPGLGGRNQEFVLAAAEAAELAHRTQTGPAHNWALLSGGTDGEDGPTDAAGGILDDAVLARIQKAELDIPAYLRRHDSWTLLQAVGGLLRTGATHTNVMDIAVALAVPTKRHNP